MTYAKKNSGFTLIELIAVIALISIMLAFAVPNFQALIADNSRKTASWIILTVKNLKQKAVHDQVQYLLHVSIDENKMWYTGESTNADDGSPKGTGPEFKLPRGMKIIDVEFPGEERISSGQVDIEFHKKGYSDKAIIHIQEKEEEYISYLIEPFLLKTKQHEGYVSFED